MQKSASIQPRTSPSKFGSEITVSIIYRASCREEVASRYNDTRSMQVQSNGTVSPLCLNWRRSIAGRGHGHLLPLLERRARAFHRRRARVPRGSNWLHLIHTENRLVLGCINADFCDQILILQRFSRSTRFSHFRTARISKF